MTKKKDRKIDPRSLPPLDERLRYSLEEAAGYLRVSRPRISGLIAEGALRIITDRGRKFIPGTEILRHSRVA